MDYNFNIILIQIMYIAKIPKIQSSRVHNQNHHLQKLNFRQQLRSGSVTSNPNLPIEINNIEQVKPPFNDHSQSFHTMQFRFDHLTPQRVQKKISNHQSFNIKKRKAQREKKINPYTQTEYLCFRTSERNKKQEEKLRKQERINRILNPFEVLQFTMKQNKHQRAHSFFKRPKTTLDKKILEKSKITIRERRNSNSFRKPDKALDLEIKPWEEEFNVMRKF